MKTNLGQLLKHIEVLDEAASRAPMDRNTTITVINNTTALRTAVQELYQAARESTEALAALRSAAPEPATPAPRAA